jgi:hypothetical protein
MSQTEKVVEAETLGISHRSWKVGTKTCSKRLKMKCIQSKPHVFMSRYTPECMTVHWLLKLCYSYSTLSWDSAQPWSLNFSIWELHTESTPSSPPLMTLRKQAAKNYQWKQLMTVEDCGIGWAFIPTSNVASKRWSEFTLKVAAALFSEIWNLKHLTVQIPEGPSFTLNFNNKNRMKIVNCLIYCFSIQYILFSIYFLDAVLILNGYEISS